MQFTTTTTTTTITTFIQKSGYVHCNCVIVCLKLINNNVALIYNLYVVNESSAPRTV